MDALSELKMKCRRARQASRRLSYAATPVKNAALEAMAAGLISHKDRILEANAIDQIEARNAGMNPAMLDRLILTEHRLEVIAADVRCVAALPDPVGEFFDMRTLPNGLVIGKKRVPLGVIAAIYESRPNVTVDITALCLKSGNAVVLRGGKETLNTNKALVEVIIAAIESVGIDSNAVQFLDTADRALVSHLLKMSDQIDLVIPRGGTGLINFVKENSTVPVVAGGAGVCHTYVDASAKIENAVAIVYNAKIQKPSACNALDTILVHKDIAEHFLPKAAAELNRMSVELHCDPRSMGVLSKSPGLKLVPAVEDDWGREYLSLTAAVKVVDSLDEAVDHIAAYGDGHSEAIITEDYSAASRFMNEVDAAAVYVNASTRFTDGAQFGLGAEVGISTQKMHARGPLGLREITSYKWLVYGSGHVRP
ncbi:glutamate-5-semialdehyde dehydrogenase [Dehalogenimonas alkenigignens]|uniref:Gamma-glutamyl phosphate reductase n=1 Tax=Dehalogenimonas alkenigignens TaxID=1217799 RepID=A0A0W0GI16_9CHLR|nr:glutamate-5-semialdehyde dehydrogenase [Dehalogenimonas alkenigignens]KTB48179.1 glutamate-5-semialdehyde dehydrogenase [Dehalogenimonas alkenigignens]PVV84419.1 glutamate-5-semialdehyde dehydrogenase [Dehalogenimonas alkenigignens]